jgi:hypothetical protein
MKPNLVSIGGCGGCPVIQAINDVVGGQAALPYDWLMTTQSFVIRSFLQQDTFIDFSNSNNVRDGTKMITNERDAMSIHDFSSHEQEKSDVISKYKRRFDRLNEIMESDEPVLLIRRTINEPLSNINEWREKELIYAVNDNFVLWANFRNKLSSTYNKPNIYILLMTESLEEYTSNKYLESENVFIRHCQEAYPPNHTAFIPLIVDVLPSVI